MSEKQKERKDVLKSVVVLVVICLLVSTALAVVNHFTAPVSKANAEKRERAAMQDAVPEDGAFSHRLESDYFLALSAAAACIA